MPARTSLLLLIALLAGPRGTEAQECPSTAFLAPDSYPATLATAGAVGTLDGDGQLDLVTIEEFAIVRRLGVGGGRFGDPETVGSIQINSRGLVIADLLGDASMDIAATMDGLIRILEGNGDGTFETPLDLTGASTKDALAAADLDGDGFQDLIVSQAPTGVLLLLGDGTGSFVPHASLATTGFVVDILLSNVDGQAGEDILSTDLVGSVYLFPALGGGDFGSAVLLPVGLDARQIAGGDFDDDSVPDIAAGVGSGISILYGLGDGEFTAAFQIPTGLIFVDGLVAGDFSGDGIDDLVFSGAESSSGFIPDRLGVLGGWPTRPLRPASGILLGTVGPSGGELGFLAAANLDGEGPPDLIRGGRLSLRVVRHGDEEPFRAGRLTQIPQPPGSVVSADFNGDRFGDVAAVVASEIRILLGSGDGSFHAGESYTVFPAHTLLAADVDGDGRLDLLAASAQQPNPILIGNGDGTFREELSVPQTQTSMAAGDWDGDGRVDLAILFFNLIQVYRGMGEGGFVFWNNLTPLLPGEGALFSADLNLDGKSELLVLTPSTFPSFQAALRVFPGTSSGLGSAQIYSLKSTAESVAVADFTQDGLPDVAVAGNVIGILPGIGSGQLGGEQFVGVAGPGVVAALDVDGDGFSDLAALQFESIVTLRSVGGGLFEQPRLYSTGMGIESLVVGELDGGGAPDLLFTMPTRNLVGALRNSRLSARIGGSTSVACPGGRVVFRAIGVGHGPLAYQWRKDTVPLVNGGGVSGATTKTLTVDPVAAGDAGVYDVVVTDLCADATSPGVLLSVAAQPAPPPIFVRGTVTPLPGHVASVDAVEGHAYSWTLTGGTITSGQGTSRIAFTPGSAGTTMLLTVQDSLPACAPVLSSRFVQVQFADVSLQQPESPFIHAIARNLVTAGCGGGLFCPLDLVTRAQMAIFLLRSKNGPTYTPPTATGTVFLDVPAGAFAADYIEALAAAQVTSGCGGGNYCPNAFVTREQMAVFLLRTLEGPVYTPPPCISPTFSDVPCSSGFAPWIEELVLRGITAGCGGGNYCPASSVTRAQMAVFLVSTFDLS